MGQGYVIKHMIFFTGYDSLQFLIRRVKPGVYSEGTIQSHKFTNGTGGPPFMAVSLIPCAVNGNDTPLAVILLYGAIPAYGRPDIAVYRRNGDTLTDFQPPFHP